MSTLRLKLVTLVAERLVRDKILRLLEEQGARGWTITEATGRGSRGVRASEWEGRNVRIETVVSPAVAELVVEQVAERFFQHHAVIVYVQDVEVVRGEKYV